MKWIVLAIVLCIVPYTWLTLQHRKPGPAYLPYADNKDRAEVIRLLDAGYRRFALPLTAIAGRDEASAPAGMSHRPGGLPPLLQEVLIDPVRLPESVQLVAAPASARTDEAIRLVLRISSAAGSEAVIFVRQEEVTIAPLAAADAPAPPVAHPQLVELILPAGTLPAGSYRFSVLAAQAAPTWAVVIGP